MARSSRPRALVLVAALTFAAALPSGASANHTWRGYHWARTTTTFTVNVGSNVSKGWSSYLGTAANDWSKSAIADMKVSGGATKSCSLSQSVGTIQVCNAFYGGTGWLGIAQISISGKHIVAATVKLNDTYFSTASYDTPAWRALVTCQEVGHGIGLDHQDENFGNANLGTCMDYTRLPDSNQHPNQHDFDQIASIYNHVDTTSTLQGATGFIAGAVQGLRAGEPADAAWGALVDASGSGHGSTYLRDLGGGAAIVTHVFWVEGAEDGHPH